MCLLSHASVLFPSDPPRLKWTTGETKCWGGGGSDKKLILTEGQQGEHHSACYLGIELGFGGFLAHGVYTSVADSDGGGRDVRPPPP